ncbi:MAG: competence protein ComK [Erysipelotrichales bacterium]|nr:competence protein ComK [Erysipelotrichales bacterium]
MLEKIINTAFGAKLVYQDKELLFKESTLKVIRNLCERRLFTLEGYLQAVKKILPISYKIPIVITDNFVLFQTESSRNFTNIWINYKAIMDTKEVDKKLIITFLSGNSLTINWTKKGFKRLEENIRIIEEYKRSLETSNLSF